jgi:hypothetical protein
MDTFLSSCMGIYASCVPISNDDGSHYNNHAGLLLAGMVDWWWRWRLDPFGIEFLASFPQMLNSL